MIVIMDLLIVMVTDLLMNMRMITTTKSLGPLLLLSPQLQLMLLLLMMMAITMRVMLPSLKMQMKERQLSHRCKRRSSKEMTPWLQTL